MISLCTVRGLRIPLPSAFAVAVASLLLWSSTVPKARADAAAGAGTVAGKVVDKGGNGVAGAKVRLVSGGQKGRKLKEGKAAQRKGRKAARGAAAGLGDEQEQQEQAPVVLIGKRNRAAGKGAGKGGRAAPAAQAVTDNDGTFRMENVPAGSYSIVARAKGAGVARRSVTVDAGETATVTLELGQKQAKAGKAGKAKGRGAGKGPGKGGGGRKQRKAGRADAA